MMVYDQDTVYFQNMNVLNVKNIVSASSPIDSFHIYFLNFYEILQFVSQYCIT